MGGKFQVRNFRGFPRGAYFQVLLLLVSGRVNGVGISHRIHGTGIIYLPLLEKNQPNVKLSLRLLVKNEQKTMKKTQPWLFGLWGIILPSYVMLCVDHNKP